MAEQWYGTHNSLFLNMLFTRFYIKSLKGRHVVCDRRSKEVKKTSDNEEKKKNSKSINATKQIDKEA